MLSINQMAVTATVILTNKIVMTAKSKYLADGLEVGANRQCNLKILRKCKYRLWLTAEGFLEGSVEGKASLKRQTKLWKRSIIPPNPP